MIPQETRQAVLDLYRTKYYGANFTHFTELLGRIEGIGLSISTVSVVLEDAFLLSQGDQGQKKRIVRSLRKNRNPPSQRRRRPWYRASLVAVEDAHSRRPRCAYFGELEQMDATPYDWVPGQTWHLHLAIDDATGAITGAWFDTQETLNGYYHVLRQMLEEHGIPYKLFTDRRMSLPTRKKLPVHRRGYFHTVLPCLQAAGDPARIQQCSSGQGPGGTPEPDTAVAAASRTALAGATTIETANEFLHSYVKEFNAKFALHPDSIKSVFEVQPLEKKINLVLAVLSERTVDCNHCIQYEKKYYRMLNTIGMQEHYRKGTKVMVIRAFDGAFIAASTTRTSMYWMKYRSAKRSPGELDADYAEPRPKKQYIPPMNHPWRRRSSGGSSSGRSTISMTKFRLRRGNGVKGQHAGRFAPGQPWRSDTEKRSSAGKGCFSIPYSMITQFSDHWGYTTPYP